MVNDLIQI